VRGRLAGPVGPGLLQDLGGEEDGVAVVVPHGVVSLEHGDQQRGAGRLDAEQDADAAVGGRARPELQQVFGQRLEAQLLKAQFLLDLAGDLVEPGCRLGGIGRPPGIVTDVLGLLDQLLGLGRRVSRLQDFLPGPEGVDLHLLPLGHRGQLVLGLPRGGEALPQCGGVRRWLQLGELKLDALPQRRRPGHLAAHGVHRFQPGLIVLVQGRLQVVWRQPDRHGGYQRGAETVTFGG
jgi:hypothetical protein